MKSSRKIFGAIGLLLVLTSPLTFVVTAGQWTLVGIKLGVGAIFLFVYLQGRHKAPSSSFLPKTWFRKG